jgi:hypothetical protein
MRDPSIAESFSLLFAISGNKQIGADGVGPCGYFGRDSRRGISGSRTGATQRQKKGGDPTAPASSRFRGYAHFSHYGLFFSHHDRKML